MTDWIDIRLLLDMNVGIKDLTQRQLLHAIYTATANDLNAADHLIDPTGELKFKVNQLMNSFIRHYGMDDVLEEKVRKCETIYGTIDA